MKINWPPSLKTITEAKKAYELRSIGTPIKEIQKLLPYHKTYIFALVNLWKQWEIDHKMVLRPTKKGAK